MTNLEQMPSSKAGKAAITKQEKIDNAPKPGGSSHNILPPEETSTPPSPKLSPEQSELERLVTLMGAEMKKIADNKDLTWEQKQQQEEKLSQAYLRARAKITGPGIAEPSKPESSLYNPEKGLEYKGFGKKIKNLLKRVLE